MAWLLMFTLRVSEPIRKVYRLRHMACALDATELLAASSKVDCPVYQEIVTQALQQLVALRMGAGAFLLPLVQI